MGCNGEITLALPNEASRRFGERRNSVEIGFRRRKVALARPCAWPRCPPLTQCVGAVGRLLFLAAFLFANLTEQVRAHDIAITAAPSRFELPLEAETQLPTETTYPAIFAPEDRPNIGFVASANPINNTDPSGMFSVSESLCVLSVSVRAMNS